MDKGVVYLVSPAIDLSGVATAELKYTRWFFNRDRGEDAGDFFVAEVSDDDGNTWTDVETLDTDQRANSWEEISVSLEDLISLTAQVRVRFGAADGSSRGNIIEAAIDNVEITGEAVCEDDLDCDDGLFCNGAESCEPGGCQAGAAPCPGQACDESNDACEDCLTDGDCDDDLFCNGQEICVDNSCQAGTVVDCDDGLSCTVDSCDETTDVCDQSPDHAVCDDGLFCNGEEICDGAGGCTAGSDPCQDQYCDEGLRSCYECESGTECDDGSYCNGEETCEAGFCQSGTDPCSGQACDEGSDACVSGPVFEDDFENGNLQGWTLVGGQSTASTGDWAIGDPVGTSTRGLQAQPADAFDGQGCVFTAQNSSLGRDDVDKGVIYLVSPAIDLSSATFAELTYVRWFFNRDTGEDAGDFFVAEVSDDDGSTWTSLDSLDTYDRANAWTEMSFALESHIALTSAVRIRFGAADGSSRGNIIEAAIDNVALWGS